MVKRKKDRMEPEELQDEINAEFEEPVEVEEVPQPEVSVPNASFDEVVDQVIRGEWGVGQDRRRRLADAGYDHVAVRKEITRRINTK